MARVITICNKAIEYLFYALFFFVPLTFLPVTSELFEFNKMILTYALTVLIGTFWAIKMVASGQFRVQRTPLDIPILLFLASQVISTILSIDVHTSIWGYYSRSNGGLLSIISYIFLYYALASNFTAPMIKRLLLISLISGAVVAFYGVLEHFGIDKDKWVQDVQNRVFSTLGQPNWLAAYLSILIPISIAFSVQNSKFKIFNFKLQLLTFNFALLTILFYLTLLYTKSRSGFVGLWVGLIFFLGYLWLTKNKQFLNLKSYIIILLLFGSITFIVGSPFEQLRPFTLDSIRSRLEQQSTINDQQSTKPQGTVLETGGTESGEIRKIVWQGAIDIARHYPLFGSGVETFAYSYYQYRPVAHNLTSEWDFLYNKAHNEYLNYAATTGIFGLGSYFIMIITFIIFILKKRGANSLLVTGLLASYLSILVSNFFGFSVVVTNLFFFLIPAFVFVLNGSLNPEKESEIRNNESWLRWIGILAILVTCYLLLATLFRIWSADTDYALGKQYNRAGEYEQAYDYLINARQRRPDEPLFADELAVNNTALALTKLEQNQSTAAANFAAEAVQQSSYTIKTSPNNPTFWRSRIRVFTALSQMDEKYYAGALDAAQKSIELSPTDPEILYNYALILAQTGKVDEAILQLKKAQNLKTDYREPVYALGILYHELGGDYLNLAISQMEKLVKIASTDSQAQEKLIDWRGY